MTTKRFTIRAAAGLTLLAGLTGRGAAADTTVEQMLARKPTQTGVAVTTPAGADLAGCKAEQMAWPKAAGGATPTGTVLKDAQGRTVRQFVDTTGRNSPNIFSFYLNGVEAYREIDTNGDGKPDQFRWLGPNGSKWGEDKTGDGIVDVWYVLSPEELAQELMQVLVTRNPAKLDPLLPRADELKQAGYPDAEAAKIGQRAGGIGKRVGEAIKALELTDKAKWIHLETGNPQTVPGDAVGSPTDLVSHKNATVLFDKGDGKSASAFQLGEIVQVGRTWKLVDGPTPGHADLNPTTEGAGTVLSDPKVQELVKQLEGIKPPVDNSPAAVGKYHTDRAAVLEQIVAVTQGAAQEPWLRQVIDAYAAAAETGDDKSMARLKQWQDSIAKAAPGATAAGYAAFRIIAADYAVKIGEAGKTGGEAVAKVQTWWRESLEGFVKAYPQAEDAPEAVLRLAIAYEFAGKDGETQAKNWYETLVKNYGGHPYAAKARGAARRLTSEGQAFQLAGPTLSGGQQFNVASLNGKPVVVYYWASWGRGTAAELKQIAELAKAYQEKGLQVVTVNVDNDPAQAVAAVNAAQCPGTHLHAPGGLDGSPLAAEYGIVMVPHVFLVGKDGKVVNRNAQTGPVLKDEVEKLVK